MGEITTEQQCAAAAAYLGIDYATDGSNVKESGVAHCFTKMGDAAGFAKEVDPAAQSEYFAPICLGAGTDMERRRLHPATVAAVQDASSNVKCTGAGDAICDKCHIGYFGAGTPTCTKCPKMPNCAHPIGHDLGVYCTSEADAKCGECKPGFQGSTCEPCTPIPGCVVETLTCSGPNTSQCG